MTRTYKVVMHVAVSTTPCKNIKIEESQLREFLQSIPGISITINSLDSEPDPFSRESPAFVDYKMH